VLLINSTIKHDEFILPNMGRLEAVAACICLYDNEQLLFVSTYLPPAAPVNRTDMDKIFSAFTTVVVAGDLNSKHVAWNCSSVDSNGKTLLTYCTDKNLSIHYPNQPMHFPHNTLPSILDIVLTKHCSVSKPMATPSLSSDHNPIVFKSQLLPILTTPRMVYDYKHADWKLFESTLDGTIPRNPTLLSTADLEQAVIAFEIAIRQAATTAIPLHKVVRNQLTLPPALTQILKLKNYYRRRFQGLRIPIFRYLAHIVTQIFLVKLQRLKNAKWNSFLRTLHPRKPSFWKVTRYFTATKQSIPPLLRNGTPPFRPLEKAEALARQFERAHNLTLHMSTSHHSQIITRTVNKVFRHPIAPETTIKPTNPNEIRRKILSLKPRTAPGNDEISPVLLRHLSTHAVRHLTLIFNSIFKLGYFPTIWKAAKVIPIQKQKKNHRR